MIFRTFLLILAVCATLFAAGTTANKTQSTKQNLKTKAEQEKKLNKKLDELAKSILSGEENVKTTAEQISALSVQVKELESSAKAADASLNTLIAQNKDLVAEQKRIEASLLAIISKRFAYDLIVPKNYIESEESIISAEILNSLTKDSQNQVNKIAKDYSKTINSIKSQTDKIGAIKLDLAEFRSKQNKLIALQTKQKKDLAKLKSDKDSYEKELSAIQADQEELRKTLEKLAIIAKNEEEEKARAQQKAKLKRYKKHIQKIIAFGKDLQDKCEKLFLELAKQVELAKELKEQGKDEQIDFGSLQKISAKLDKLKESFEDKLFKDTYYTITYSFIHNQELELTTIKVRPSKNDEEKKQKLLEWVSVHGHWLFSIAGMISVMRENLEKSALWLK